jgi:hypothetical protein
MVYLSMRSSLFKILLKSRTHMTLHQAEPVPSRKLYSKCIKLVGPKTRGIFRADLDALPPDLVVLLNRLASLDIFNTDQGAQCTSHDLTGRLAAAGVLISRDGRGRVLDEVFGERLGRTVTYDSVG